MNAPNSHCHCCGSKYEIETWPRTCTSCGNIHYANPQPIGVLLQTVTDGTRTGILTPVRGIEPQRGHIALVGGFQELRDQGSEDCALREMLEETGMSVHQGAALRPLCTRATGPILPGRRQNLVFTVNEKALPVEIFDGFEANEETLRIEFSWEPQRLAFPSHTYALARYFEVYHGQAVQHYLDQPAVGDIAQNGLEVTNVPYMQPLLDCSKAWVVETGAGPSLWRAEK